MSALRPFLVRKFGCPLALSANANVALRVPISIALAMFCIVGCLCCAPTMVRGQEDANPRISKPANTLAQNSAARQPLGDERWLFLGDSNTYAGGFVATLDAWLEKAFGGNKPQILNLGVSSETAAGTSEVDHPFRRPCVHERIDKTLAMTRPTLVFICYGMNDGTYAPPSEENFAAYRSGMLKLAKTIRQAGARLVCLTPPPFEADVLARIGKLGPSAKTGRFAYFAPAENYDEVLAQQADWCLQNEMQADLVIDTRTLLLDEKTRRLQDDSKFAFSTDGIHFGAEAHGLIAERIVRELGATDDALQSFPTLEEISVASKRLQLMRDALLSATGKNRPSLPAGWPVWYAQQLARRVGE